MCIPTMWYNWHMQCCTEIGGSTFCTIIGENIGRWNNWEHRKLRNPVSYWMAKILLSPFDLQYRYMWILHTFCGVIFVAICCVSLPYSLTAHCMETCAVYCICVMHALTVSVGLSSVIFSDQPNLQFHSLDSSVKLAVFHERCTLTVNTLC